MYFTYIFCGAMGISRVPIDSLEYVPMKPIKTFILPWLWKPTIQYNSHSILSAYIDWMQALGQY